MKTLPQKPELVGVSIALAALLILFLTSCTTDYVETPHGARLYLGQVGGQKTIQEITVADITIKGYQIQNETSFKDTMDFAGTWVAIKGAVDSLKSTNAKELAMVESDNAVTSTGIKEAAKTERAAIEATKSVELSKFSQ